MWDENRREQDTNQPPHHLVVRRCATPSEPPQPPLRRRLRQTQHGRDLLVAHASDVGKEFLCGQDYSHCKNVYKHLGFESNVTCGVWIGAMSRCLVDVKCAKPVVL